MSNVDELYYIKRVPKHIQEEWDTVVSRIREFIEANNGKIKGGMQNGIKGHSRNDVQR